jgi:YggT family protein
MKGLPTMIDALVWLLSTVINLIVLVLIVQAVLSWLIAFNVVNASNQFVSMIWRFTTALTEPMLKPIRKIIPNLGGIDISPIVLILGLMFLQRLVIGIVY